MQLVNRFLEKVNNMSHQSKNNTREIKVDYLARVEGEGALRLLIEQDQVKQAQLRIFEPPRFFESFMPGRDYKEAPDITARICGICPVAYQMSAVHAMEQICSNVEQAPETKSLIRDLRRLLYCGEWIESHILHIYMLHAPDFLGYDDAIALAKDHKNIVQRGLRLKKIGNEMIRCFGGREIHPINVKVGGFYKLPTEEACSALLEQLNWGRQAALETIEWVSAFYFEDFEQDYEFVSLYHGNVYPLNEGVIKTRSGLSIKPNAFEQHFFEKHEAHTNALHATFGEDQNYFVGPMARYFHNYAQLPRACKQAASDAGLNQACYNPFKSIIVRAIEVLFAFEEAQRILEDCMQSSFSWCDREIALDLTVQAGIGYAATEAPRGLLWHRYEIDEQGVILSAKIVPPTSQNQRIIESDIGKVAQQNVMKNDQDLTHILEQAIRNYDPCISCATHFLNLEVVRL